MCESKEKLRKFGEGEGELQQCPVRVEKVSLLPWLSLETDLVPIKLVVELLVCLGGVDKKRPTWGPGAAVRLVDEASYGSFWWADRLECYFEEIL